MFEDYELMECADTDLTYVYVIKSNENDKKYVGCTDNPYQRLNYHFTRLRSGKHEIEAMQSDFNKYGEQAFSFEIVDCGSHARMLCSETKWMYFFKTYDSSKGYNTKDRKVQVADKIGVKSLINCYKLRKLIRESIYSYDDLAMLLGVTRKQMLCIMASNCFYLTNLYKIAKILEIEEEEIEKLIIY